MLIRIHTHSLPLCHTHTTHTLKHTLCLSHTHTYTHMHSLSHTHTHAYSNSHSLTISHTLTHALTYLTLKHTFHYLYLSQAHTNTSHFQTHFYISLSLFHTHTTISHSQTLVVKMTALREGGGYTRLSDKSNIKIDSYKIEILTMNATITKLFTAVINPVA
jgi:hypothetical protein